MTEYKLQLHRLVFIVVVAVCLTVVFFGEGRAVPPQPRHGKGIIIFYAKGEPIVFFKFWGYSVRALPAVTLGELMPFLMKKGDFLGLGYRYTKDTVSKIYRCMLFATNDEPKISFNDYGTVWRYKFTCKGDFEYIENPRRTDEVSLEDDRRRGAVDGWDRVIIKFKPDFSEEPENSSGDGEKVKTGRNDESASKDSKTGVRPVFVDDYPKVKKTDEVKVELFLTIPYIDDRLVLSGRVGVEKVFYDFAITGKHLKLDAKHTLKEQIFEYADVLFPGLVDEIQFHYVVSGRSGIVRETYVRSSQTGKFVRKWKKDEEAEPSQTEGNANNGEFT